MKRKGNFYYDICNKDNIKKAIIEAAKGKKDRGNVARITENIDKYVDILFIPYSKSATCSKNLRVNCFVILY